MVVTESRAPIVDLDAWRIGWELIDRWDDYQCFGFGRAAILQFCADALTAAPTAASMGSGSTGGIAIRQSWQTKSNVCIATMGSIS